MTKNVFQIVNLDFADKILLMTEENDRGNLFAVLNNCQDNMRLGNSYQVRRALAVRDALVRTSNLDRVEVTRAFVEATVNLENVSRLGTLPQRQSAQNVVRDLRIILNKP
ncbi:hypothetical protein ACFL2C_01460 [Patescibacteria group bacterium]